MNRLLGSVALVGFILALIVHIAALMGLDLSERIPAVWGLHLGIFVVFIPFVISSRKSLGPKPTFVEIRAAFPAWVVVPGACIFVYAIINFGLSVMGSDGGNPSIVDGKFVLLNHGKLIRELTAIEYSAINANQVRGFSGHWLVFYYLPLAYFLFRKESSKPCEDTASATELPR